MSRVIDDWADVGHDDWQDSSTSSHQLSEAAIKSNQAVSRMQYESNLPESTIKSRTMEAARGILEPFDLHNVPGLLESVGSAMYDALSGKGTAKAQELVKAAIKAPVEPVKNVVEGISTGDYDKAAYGAGGILSQTVPAVDQAVGLVKRVVPPVKVDTAADLYKTALKAPTTMPVEDVKAIVKTALEHEIPISEAGVQKLNSLVSDFNAAIDAKVKGSGGSISKYDVAKRLGPTAQTFANQVSPTSDLNAISQVGNDFLETQPANIPNETAQSLKKGTYKQLSGKYGELANAQVEAQKALARGLKEELANQIPELTGLNAKEAALLDLSGVLERAVNRAANANKGRIGPMLAGGVTKALTGSTAIGTATGILKAVLDDPETASKLAIAINKAQQSNPTKFGPPNITAAMQKIQDLSAALSKASATATAAKGATTNADSSGTQ